MDFVGSKLKARLTTISAIQANRDLASGVEAYLVQVATKSIERKSVMGIPIVKEFSGVFANDLPRLPLVRETKFTIDLEPRVAPMHQAPY